MVEVMKIMVNPFKRSHAPTATLSAPTLQQATRDPIPHWRVLDTHGQVWVNLFWSHCSFLLGPVMHKVLSVRAKCEVSVSSNPVEVLIKSHWPSKPDSLEIPSPFVRFPA